MAGIAKGLFGGATSLQFYHGFVVGTKPRKAISPLPLSIPFSWDL